MEGEIKHIIESLLFVSDEPLSIERICETLAINDPGPVQEALNDLDREYGTRKGGFELRRIADGFQLRTRPEYAEWIRRLKQPSPKRISKASLETLAIIAYRQPVMRSDIEYIRGVDCGGVLRILLEKKLIRIMGRKSIPGRPMVYGTTRYFLELFELNSLKDLPTPDEIQAYGDPPAVAPAAVLKTNMSLPDDDTQKNT
ncbi:MAG: SMC-Scp complex subunit ScpB [Desulfobacterales bacterium]|nr:SMC-Scp complex subunit ScpB [Desulfobacterales bacterium]MDD3081713.1 SMC-Scp complex subunit ScpB [Desulfobacterales bacterium]MDD3949805.1 SMC-Scp complex subunit ScpB [Desulfobacterales bacterium]MDD4464810.1 SMC-Scp complex subunit ScpB [Desulfobacterales bacterium]